MMGNPRIDCLGCRLANSQEKSHIIFKDSFVTCLLDITSHLTKDTS
ncbi:hypothetical protein SAMN04487776_103344 [Priestia megaterium]|nr:hypothetical protein SAMN04487776_103344 [Priestia megaterium]